MRTIRSVRSAFLTIVAAVGVLLLAPAAAQRDDAKFVDAAKVLELFTTDEEHGIPTDILQRARGIAVIPNLIRGGFLFGGRRGRGVLAIRSPNGEWSNPAFVTLTGGSFGAQFGAESADVVLVFANDRAVRNIASGKFTLGGDATAIAGPLGRRTQRPSRAEPRCTCTCIRADCSPAPRSRGRASTSTKRRARRSTATRAACRWVHRRPRRRPPRCRFSMRCELPPCCPARRPSSRRMPARPHRATRKPLHFRWSEAARAQRYCFPSRRCGTGAEWQRGPSSRAAVKRLRSRSAAALPRRPRSYSAERVSVFGIDGKRLRARHRRHDGADGSAECRRGTRRGLGSARNRGIAPTRLVGRIGSGAALRSAAASASRSRSANNFASDSCSSAGARSRSARKATAVAARRALAHSSSFNVSSRFRLQRIRTPSLARPSSMKSMMLRGSGSGAHAASAAASRSVTPAWSRTLDSPRLRIATGADTLLPKNLLLRKTQRTIARGRANGPPL